MFSSFQLRGQNNGRSRSQGCAPDDVRPPDQTAETGDWCFPGHPPPLALYPIVNINTGTCYGIDVRMNDGDDGPWGRIHALLEGCLTMDSLAEAEQSLRRAAVTTFLSLPHWRQTKLFWDMDARLLQQGAIDTAQLRKELERHGIQESQLVFQLSGHLPASIPPRLLESCRHLRHAGFRLAIADFGMGSGGLQALHAIEPDFLKIDRFFIDGIATESKKRMFLSQIVNIAHLMGVVVVADGVETEREYFTCRDAGCDLIQGPLVQTPSTDSTTLTCQYEVVENLARGERRKGGSDQKLIADQISFVDPIPQDCTMEEVFERFRADKSLTFFPVVDAANEPVGIVREKELKDYTYSLYGKALISNKTIGRKLKDFVVRCPMADIHTRAEHILQAYSAVEGSEGIIIVKDMKYAGFLSAHSLLRVINEKNLATARDQNPLTKLPGNHMIHQYVSECLADTDTEHVLAYFDFDNFKPFNDKYGFRLGDRAILLFAELLSKALSTDSCFPAHVGGDDFFGGFRGLDFATVQSITAKLVEQFRQDVESFYDDETRQRGHIIGQDRVGNVVRFPLMTVSAVLVHLAAGRPLYTVDDVSQTIAVLKKEAKHSPDRIASASLTPLR